MTIAAGDRVVVAFSVHRWIHADVTEPWQWSLDRQREYLKTDRGTVYRENGVLWWLARSGLAASDWATVTSVEKALTGEELAAFMERWAKHPSNPRRADFAVKNLREPEPAEVDRSTETI